MVHLLEIPAKFGTSITLKYSKTSGPRSLLLIFYIEDLHPTHIVCALLSLSMIGVSDELKLPTIIALCLRFFI